MIFQGGDPRDKTVPDWWAEEEALERELDARRDEYEQKLIDEALKELLRERGAKTGAQHRLKKGERAKACQEAAARIWADHPALTKKAVALVLERANKEKFGSANTIRSMIKKSSAK